MLLSMLERQGSYAAVEYLHRARCAVPLGSRRCALSPILEVRADLGTDDIWSRDAQEHVEAFWTVFGLLDPPLRSQARARSAVEDCFHAGGDRFQSPGLFRSVLINPIPQADRVHRSIEIESIGMLDLAFASCW